MNDVAERVIGVLRGSVSELAGVNLRPESALISSGYIDSAELMRIITVLEGEFGVQFRMEELDLADFESAASIARRVVALAKTSPAVGLARAANACAPDDGSEGTGGKAE